MIAFLLGLIPGPWLLILKKLPWRLIGYGLAAVVVVWVVLTINGWRQDSHALKATEKALATSQADLLSYVAREEVARQALREAEGKAIAREAEDRAIAERVERELQDKLAAADARGRDLARRLRLHAARACAGGGAVPAAPVTPGEPATAPAEPGDGQEIERATESHLVACSADAERLAGWQTWWARVSAGR